MLKPGNPNTEERVLKAFRKFEIYRKAKHRFSSFDYCYYYFKSINNKKLLSNSSNLEKSCLHLVSYLASWGMYRGSSFLLKEKSIKYFEELIRWISQCPPMYWKIDVDNYNNENIKILLKIYSSISKIFGLSEDRSPVLVTKIMLGVFGNTPAYDRNFRKTFSKHFSGKPGFTRYNEKSLIAVREFYSKYHILINQLNSKTKTLDFLTGKKTNTAYTKAKIIDMIGFGHQI
ncbi:MAG: hypothetical protein Q8M94_18365, partial [Ignavibacteria bacterium]|nr:hypothetical protein [Ignavibacteria bacterium]